ncbi:hypothetical protein Glove_120g237 [Diversispora epigaea]|uniref:Uncharacterized protein n=1 Tax=Diversispora epigaea TaxID=1348612 RepID=A0A397J643_9GLOM|nr:hypothetical protein Glove_120g237 [Diversispora epigaea]
MPKDTPIDCLQTSNAGRNGRTPVSIHNISWKTAHRRRAKDMDPKEMPINCLQISNAGRNDRTPKIIKSHDRICDIHPFLVLTAKQLYSVPAHANNVGGMKHGTMSAGILSSFISTIHLFISSTVLSL